MPNNINRLLELCVLRVQPDGQHKPLPLGYEANRSPSHVVVPVSNLQVTKD
jgi:hypothetical protein